MNEALIVDDEKLARLRIHNLLIASKSIKVVHEASSLKCAMELINQKKPELIFLDMNLKGESGMDILTYLQDSPNDTVTIVTTAYQKYALSSFNKLAFGFLLKPLDTCKFYKILNRANCEIYARKLAFASQILEQNVIGLKSSQHFNKLDSIPIKVGNKYVLIRLDEILYFNLEETKKYMVTLNNMHDIKFSGTKLKSYLPNTFIQVKQSSFINLKHVKGIISSDFGELDLRMANGELIRISRKFKNNFHKTIGKIFT